MIRVAWQSMIERASDRGYLPALERHLHDAADEGTTIDLVDMTPSAASMHRITEMRCGAGALRNGLAAQEAGCDVFVVGHFQEPYLGELRSALEIPVLGLGETSVLHACTVGRRLGIVTINPYFIPWIRDQVEAHGVGGRVVGVTAITTTAADLVGAFGDEAAAARLAEAFAAAAAPLVAGGAEVILGGGGLPALLFATGPRPDLGGPILHPSVTVLLKQAETAVRIHRLTGVAVSRAGAFAAPSKTALAELTTESRPRPPAGPTWRA